MFYSLAKLLHVEVKFMHRIHQRNLGQSLVHDVGVSERVLKGKVSESTLLRVFDWKESLFNNEYMLYLT